LGDVGLDCQSLGFEEQGSAFKSPPFSAQNKTWSEGCF